MSTVTAPEKLVGALSSGLSVLRYLSATPSPIGVSRIARDLGINSSTCFNLLKTLVHEGLVHFDEEVKTYAISLGLVELAKGSLEQKAYIRMIRPHLEEISRAHRVTTTLWHCSRAERVVLVDRADNDHAIGVHMSIGQRLPIYVGALGRALVAHSGLSTVEMRSRFSELRWENAPSFDNYLAEVNEARSCGYAIDNGHLYKGVLAVAAAILDSNGHPIMAISTVAISAQFNKSAIKALGADLRDRRFEVSRAMSGRSLQPSSDRSSR